MRTRSDNPTLIASEYADLGPVARILQGNLVSNVDRVEVSVREALS